MVGVLSQLPITASGSALFANAGSAGSSVLQANQANGTTALLGDLGSTTTSLVTQIKANANLRLLDEQQAIEERTRQQRDAINTLNERWINVKAQINNAQVAVDSGQESLEKSANTLLLMRGSVEGAADDPDFYLDQFNDFVNELYNEAESAGNAFNLVGNINPIDYTPNQIEYRTDLGFGSTTLTGTYIGTNFRIFADDGTVWEPDLGTDILQATSSQGGPKQEYTTDDGVTINKATSTRSGITLNSYDPDTGAVSLDISIVPTDAPITVTGTLERTGLGIMQSWFYNDFATEADRAAAFQDISNAEIDLTSAGAEIARSAAQLSIDQKRVNQALDDLTEQSADVSNKEFDELEEVRIRAAQQFLAMEANLDNLSRQQRNYLDAFAGFISSPFLRATLDLRA